MVYDILPSVLLLVMAKLGRRLQESEAWSVRIKVLLWCFAIQIQSAKKEMSVQVCVYCFYRLGYQIQEI